MKKVYGYARVSTKEQHLDRQMKALLDFGIEERDIVTDKSSGMSMDREGYAEGTITAEDYVAMGQEYAQKADELRIFLSEIKKESRKYDPEYLGGEHWAKLVADFKDQKTLDRKMVEAFVNKLTLYNDGRAEIEFNFRDELEEVLLWAAMRKKEVNKYAG